MNEKEEEKEWKRRKRKDGERKRNGKGGMKQEEDMKIEGGRIIGKRWKK